jgi:hypothetical protein
MIALLHLPAPRKDAQVAASQTPRRQALIRVNLPGNFARRLGRCGNSLPFSGAAAIRGRPLCGRGRGLRQISELGLLCRKKSLDCQARPFVERRFQEAAVVLDVELDNLAWTCELLIHAPPASSACNQLSDFGSAAPPPECSGI